MAGMRPADAMMTSIEMAGERGEAGSSAAPDGEQPPEPDEPARDPRSAPTAASPVVEVVTRPGLSLRPDSIWLRDRLQDVVGLLNRPVKRIHVTIAPDAFVSEVNRRHLGREGTTDVLSFPDDDDPESLQADIIICADEAARQADRRGHSTDRELLLYALHGLLHCAGYDDQDPESFREIHAEEDRLLEAIGVGATFDRSAPGEAVDEAARARRRRQGPGAGT